MTTIHDLHGYIDDYHYLRICATCYELYEEGRPDGQNQHCRCVPRGLATWPRYDFDERALLCRCCGQEALHSGSKWSPFFCDACKPLAMGVSIWHRRLIFPIGRHTIMHTWVPKTPWPSLQAHGGDTTRLGAGVLSSLQAVSKGSDGLWEWYPIIMARNLGQLALDGDVRLQDYLEAVERAESDVLSNRLKAFEGLCEFFQSGPPLPESVQTP
jgi:hypothetical protein